MKRGPGSGRMPSAEEILRTKLWTLGHYIKTVGGLTEHRVLTPDGVYFAEIMDVEDLSNEMEPKIIIHLKLKEHISGANQAEGKEPSEDSVRGE